MSGGCLEAQVVRRAWWLTAGGPTLQRHSTAEEEGERPYGSGCGGVVHLLLERRATAGPLLVALEQAYRQRVPLAVATILEGEQIGRRAFAGLAQAAPVEEEPGQAKSALCEAAGDSLCELAKLALAGRRSMERRIAMQGTEVRAWADFRPARPGVWIFGAGDDAQPLLRMAGELGWFVTVADGRAHLATRDRFPLADELHVLPAGELSPPQGEDLPPALADLRREDAAVVLSHSFEQDVRALAALLALAAPPAYIGVLGPERRTRELLQEVARRTGLVTDFGCSAETQIEDWIERWLARLHAPTGLDLGAESPETIALSIVAEIQKVFTAATAQPLRQMRSASPAVS